MKTLLNYVGVLLVFTLSLTDLIGQSAGDYRSLTSGNWSSALSWETYNGSVWVAAGVKPSGASGTITIRSIDTITVDLADSIYGAAVVVDGYLKDVASIKLVVGSFTFNNGSSYEFAHPAATGKGIPSATWNIGSTCIITGITTATTGINANQNFHHLIINCPSWSGNLNFGWGGTSTPLPTTINGNVTVKSTGSSGRWQLCAPVAGLDSLNRNLVTVTIQGNLIIDGSSTTSTNKVSVTSNGTGNNYTDIVININGNISVTGNPTDSTWTNFSVSRGSQGGTGTTNWYMHNGSITMSSVTTQNSNLAGARFVFTGSTQDLTLTNINYLGGLPVRIDSGATVNLGTSVIRGSGVFTVGDFGGINTAQDSGFVKNLLNTGTTTLSTLGNYGYNGSIAQITGSLLPLTMNTFTINNPAGVTLSGSISAGTLNLVEGKLNTDATNILTVTETSANSINGGSETAYVNGPLTRTLPSSLVAGSIYNYPVGKGSYKPLALVDPVSASGGPVVVSAEVFDANSGGTPGTGMLSLNTNRYWSANVVSGGANLTTTKVRLTEDAMTSTMGIGKSSTVAGTYNLISSSAPLGGTITSDDITSLSFFVIGEAASSTTFALSVAVTDGWNMVSVPGVNPGGQGVSTWWPNRNTLADVFKWTTTYVPVTLTDPGEGYWMLHTGAQTYNYPAIQIVAHDPIPLTTGWNMIGGYENTPLVSGLTTTPANLIVTGTVYGWTGTYSNATNLVPGYGYWVLSNGNGVINSPTSADGPAKPVVQDDKSEWGKITITDASGKSYTLYSVNGEVNLDHYQMPPLPPAGMFDVRYSSNRKAENLKENNQTIEMRGLVYPVTVRVDKMGIKLEDETGKLLSERIKSGEEVVISNSAVSKLKVTSDIIPEVYSLDQNYPNPFNPSTKIEFSIPEDVNNVTLTIYNALGQRVAELVNSKLEAGKYSYVWNASDVATGLYIYELRTDKFVSVKKMMLLK